MKNNKGFTLIEILMVVSIVAMLASVVLSSLGSAKSKGVDTAKINAIRQVKIALGMYYGDKGYYPLTTASLVPTYIPSILTGILFEPLISQSNTATCSGACTQPQYYHLAIPLTVTNRVLIGDANLTTTSINGKMSDCVTAGTNANSLCYDVTP